MLFKAFKQELVIKDETHHLQAGTRCFPGFISGYTLLNVNNIDCSSGYELFSPRTLAIITTLCTPHRTYLHNTKFITVKYLTMFHLLVESVACTAYITDKLKYLLFTGITLLLCF